VKCKTGDFVDVFVSVKSVVSVWYMANAAVVGPKLFAKYSFNIAGVERVSVAELVVFPVWLDVLLPPVVIKLWGDAWVTSSCMSR
jgi:hypothetical protein